MTTCKSHLPFLSFFPFFFFHSFAVLERLIPFQFPNFLLPTVSSLLVCFRGVVGELDEELDAHLDLSSLRAHPLKPVIHWSDIRKLNCRRTYDGLSTCKRKCIGAEWPVIYCSKCYRSRISCCCRVGSNLFSFY